MKYAIVKNDYPESTTLASNLEAELKSTAWMNDEQNPDYVFVIGGDGTFLKAVHQFNHYLDQVKFYPVKNGGIGFYTNHNLFPPHESDLKTMLCLDQCQVTQFPLLEVSVDQKTFYSINEVKILNDVAPQQLSIYVNDEKLEDFKGTGIVFATPSGTTGYLKSTNGAIIYPTDLALFEMQEIAPVSTVLFRTIHAPMIFSEQEVLRVVATTSKQTNNLIVSDAKVIGNSFQEIKVKLSAIKLAVVTTNKISRTALLKDIFVG